MIISRTPFRVSFAGGGSDLPSFYKKEVGAVVSTTIDKYMYIALHPFFNRNKIQLKYSKTELVNTINEIKHPIFREVLAQFNLTGIDLNSIADVPSGTGLGSSSAFTVGLINVVKAYLGKSVACDVLAQMACEIEINKLNSPIGKQDQYAAAYGGLNFITFYGDDTVNVEKIIMNPNKKNELEKNLILVYIGGNRAANDILQKQQKNIADSSYFGYQKKMVQQAFELKKLLENNNINDFGAFLHEGWMLKKKMATGISNADIDQIYNEGIKAGALGGKLLGAGAAGFILFYCPREKQESFRKSMQKYYEMSFKFDTGGSKIVYLHDD